MTQWEYWSFAVQSLAGQGAEKLKETLAKAGKDGWELVSVADGWGMLLFFFKRPLK